MSATPLAGDAPMLVIGAGIMGAGIAQVAAQAGHRVGLFDARHGAAAQAKDKLVATFESLVAKGRLAADAAAATLSRIQPVASLDAARETKLIIEAIVEKADAKRALFEELEAIVAEDCVLASNTSSFSITMLANGMAHPERLVGMHFFNPVPLMKLVEVISGLHTDPAIARHAFELCRAWGKVPVHARSTPGFIVNRIARPFYAEALALLAEQATTPQALDRCLRGAGFRMGPCELMDLIGHDTNFAVTSSVYEANFFDKRYAPSLVQRELVDGGRLGRKTGHGFYRYPDPTSSLATTRFEAPTPARHIEVSGSGAIADQLELALQETIGAPNCVRERNSNWVGLAIDGARLVLTDGRTAQDVAAATGIADLAVFDRPSRSPASEGSALAYAIAPNASDGWRRQAPAWLAAIGFAPIAVADTPGLVVARTIAMLINEAADAVLQGVCTAEGADTAMKLGVNYPAGPFEWLGSWSPGEVIALLETLDAQYRGERYRVSPWLRRHTGRACAA